MKYKQLLSIKATVKKKNEVILNNHEQSEQEGASIYSAWPTYTQRTDLQDKKKNEALYGLQAATAKTSILETLSCIANVLPLEEPSLFLPLDLDRSLFYTVMSSGSWPVLSWPDSPQRSILKKVLD